MGVFSRENTPEGHAETYKSKYFPYKQVSARNVDHEWLRITNTFILCDLLWNVQKNHAANREVGWEKEALIWWLVTLIILDHSKVSLS